MTDLSTLPERMRFAAAVLDEARAEFRRRGDSQANPDWDGLAWNKADLCTLASRWEDADQALVEELAMDLQAALVVSVGAYPWAKIEASPDHHWVMDARRKEAQALVDAGWTKP
ncbi:hypothetical protein FHT44_004944 [Mycolicibacterium sp. BK634]|uniref:hypothetical protein n=1 Tax=Mycolicibacterium sp. BK634 TaxID=2587099 RepID=UPI0016215BF9|nr:hypothetical protein [Mycolicibacterium sp. BK634]MBB3752432.1 hypothetical protein [Mycolicibacterium sp. BK634]